MDKFLPDFIYAPLLTACLICAFLLDDSCHPKDEQLSLCSDDARHDVDVRPDDQCRPHPDVWILCSSVRACQSYDIWGLASGLPGLTFRYENNLFIASLTVPYYDPNLTPDLCDLDRKLRCKMTPSSSGLMLDVYLMSLLKPINPTATWKVTNHSCGVDFSSVQACYSYDMVVSHSACLDSFTGAQINK